MGRKGWWFNVWDVLFPNSPRPSSVYVDDVPQEITQPYPQQGQELEDRSRSRRGVINEAFPGANHDLQQITVNKGPTSISSSEHSRVSSIFPMDTTFRVSSAFGNGQQDRSTILTCVGSWCDESIPCTRYSDQQNQQVSGTPGFHAFLADTTESNAKELPSKKAGDCEASPDRLGKIFAAVNSAPAGRTAGLSFESGWTEATRRVRGIMFHPDQLSLQQENTDLNEESSPEDLDLDFLSLTEPPEEETIQPLNPSEPLYSIISKVVERLLQGYTAINLAAGGGNRGSGSSNYSYATSGSNTSNAACRSARNASGLKRRRIDDNGDHDDGEDAGDSRSSQMPNQLSEKLPLLACPFWKRDPRKHCSCHRLKLTKINYVKQHLSRKHTPEFYCERCYAIFSDGTSHDEHVLAVVPCQRPLNARLEGITHAQNFQLIKKSNPKLSIEGKWFAIWDILFPNEAHPPSPYLDSELSEDLSSFLEYSDRNLDDIMTDVLNSHDHIPLTREERDRQTRRVVYEAQCRLYETWLSERPASAPGPTPARQTFSATSLTAHQSSITQETIATPTFDGGGMGDGQGDQTEAPDGNPGGKGKETYLGFDMDSELLDMDFSLWEQPSH